MKRATAVIGAAFGDEGKGLMTDYLVRQGDPARTVVVRYCGGAQAGHTVVTPEGLRHVFHHYGSGTLAGATTFLGSQFLVNPAAWWPEYDELSGKTTVPFLAVDPGARVTTPWDMQANQIEERELGHGSCGMGVHRTMVRHDRVPFSASDLWLSPNNLRRKILDVQNYYGYEAEHTAWATRFIDECRTFAEHAILYTPGLYLSNYDHVVFEGAQGLLLDQDSQFFPHVTHAKTGLQNVVDVCRRAQIEELEAVYVVRSYLTRHGAGPLPGESPGIGWPDDTNLENQWQGQLRFAPMDETLVMDAIAKDLAENATPGLIIKPSLSVTHLDQHGWSPGPGSFVRQSHAAHGRNAYCVRQVG